MQISVQQLTRGLAQFRQSRVGSAQASLQRFRVEVAAVALAPAEVGHPRGEGNGRGFRRRFLRRRGPTGTADEAFAAASTTATARGHARAPPGDCLTGHASTRLVYATTIASTDGEAAGTSCGVGLGRKRALEVVDHFFFPPAITF